MWIGLYDMKDAVENFEKNFDSSSMKKELEVFGEVSFSREGVALSEFMFQVNGKISTLTFSYHFKERTLQFRFKHDADNVTILRVIISEFRQWLASIGVDCLLLTREESVLPETDIFYFDGRVLSYTGKESKQIVTLMNHVPISYVVDKDKQLYIVNKGTLFRNSDLLVSFSFYPVPHVAFTLALNQFGYGDLLEAFTFKQCTTEEEIKTFFDWYDHELEKKKEISTRLYTEMAALSPEITVSHGVIKMDTLFRFNIVPFIDELSFSYVVEAPTLEKTVFVTVEEAIAACVSDYKLNSVFREFKKRMSTHLNVIGEQVIEETYNHKKHVFNLQLCKEKVRFIFDYHVDKLNQSSFYYKFNNEPSEDFSSLEELEVSFMEKLNAFIQERRVRSLFK